MCSLSHFRILCLTFWVVCFTHCHSRVATPYDSGYSIHVAKSVLEEGDCDLDEDREVIPADDYRLFEYDGHLYLRYPVAPSVLALPVVALPPPTREQRKAERRRRREEQRAKPPAQGSFRPSLVPRRLEEVEWS